MQRWFKKNDKELLAEWAGHQDPLLDAISLSLNDIDAVASAFDLGHYTKSILDALPHDTKRATGATKELLEAAMRTILDRHGEQEVEKFDFPKLSTRCFHALGLSGTTAPANEVERLTRKIASKAREIVESINELRNVAGTGHGRIAGKEPAIAAEDANMAAAIGMVLTAWLMRKDPTQ